MITHDQRYHIVKQSIATSNHLMLFLMSEMLFINKTNLMMPVSNLLRILI